MLQNSRHKGYYLHMEQENMQQQNNNQQQPVVEQPQSQSTPNKETATSNSMSPNVMAALSYVVSPITGVLVYMMEKDNKFVRFHAMQSILFGIATFVAWTIAVATTAIFIGVLLTPLVSVGSFVLWLFLIFKAYNNEEWEIPYLGKIARDQINK